MTRSRRSDGIDRRSDAREAALTLLYEAEQKGIPPREVIAGQIVDPDPMTVAIVEGVEDRRAELDGLIAEHARGWTLARMPELDKTVLRIAIVELQTRPELSKAIIIDEAVKMAKRYSTDDSGRFVNGMLSAIHDTVRPAVDQ